MDAKTINISKFLASNIQLITPIYQKEYSWSLKECEILFEDLLKIGSNIDVQSHFIGTLLLSKEETSDIIEKFQIIDGQQRITTLTLLILALASYLKNNIVGYYLLNNNEFGNYKYKLVLNGNDKDTLGKIIGVFENNSILVVNHNDSQNILQNYSFFKNKINKNNFKIIYEGFKKLIAVCISINENENTQLIYDTLNNSSLELSTAELVRNYIFLDLPLNQQKQLYENYWIYLDNEFKSNIDNFNEFIRYYLTIKLKKVSDIENIYDDFKFYADSKSNKEELIKDIFVYGQQFFNIKIKKLEDNKINNEGELEEQLKKLQYKEDPYKFFTNGKIAKTFFDSLYEYILNLDDLMILKFMKRYISFKLEKRSIVDMVPHATELKIILNMPFNKISDPKNKCRNVGHVGHWGTGEVEFRIKGVNDMDYAKFLINQSYQYNLRK